MASYLSDGSVRILVFSPICSQQHASSCFCRQTSNLGNIWEQGNTRNCFVTIRIILVKCAHILNASPTFVSWTRGVLFEKEALVHLIRPSLHSRLASLLALTLLLHEIPLDGLLALEFGYGSFILLFRRDWTTNMVTSTHSASSFVR